MPLNPSDQLDWTSDLTSSHQELQEGFQSPKPKVGEVDVPKKKCSTKSQREIGGIKSWMGGTNLIDFVVEHMLKSSLVYCLRNVMNLWTLSQTSFGNQRGGDMENQRLCVCRSGSFIRFYHWFVLVPFQGLVLFRSICLTFFFFSKFLCINLFDYVDLRSLVTWQYTAALILTRHRSARFYRQS